MRADESIIPIGWLEAGMTYPTGPVEKRIHRKLIKLCENSWSPPNHPVTAGFHECNLCQYDGPRMRGEAYIPGKGRIYVVPQGIVHYIASHWFQPPDEFLDAVDACPRMSSMEYLKAILANGGRELVRPSTQASK